MADYSKYTVWRADWAIPPDVVVLEHDRDDGTFCLVASSTLRRSVQEVLEAIEDHERAGCK